MIPNRFVILWDDFPVGIEGRFPIAPYPVKTNEPSEIYWWSFRSEAQRFVDKQPPNRKMRVVEVKFEIQNRP